MSAKTPTLHESIEPTVFSFLGDHSFTWPTVSENIAPARDDLRESLAPAPIPTTTSFDEFRFPSLAEDQGLQALVPCKEQPRAPINNSWLRKIADVNIKLFENAATIPPSSHSAGEQDGQNGLANALETKGFAIDTTFQLSKELIDILNEIKPGAGKCLRSHTTARSEVARSLLEHDTTNGATAFSSRIDHEDASIGKTTTCLLDAGSNLLIFSSYIRILDIYAKFFALIQALLSNKNGEGLSGYVHLPSLNIGTFSLHSSPALQITLFIRLVEEVFERLRNVVSQADLCCASRWSKEEDGDQVHDSVFNGVSQATLQAIRASESKITKSMNELRRKLQQMQTM